MRCATPPSGAPFAVPVAVDGWRVRVLHCLQVAMDTGDDAGVRIARWMLSVHAGRVDEWLAMPVNPVPPSSRPPQDPDEGRHFSRVAAVKENPTLPPMEPREKMPG